MNFDTRMGKACRDSALCLSCSGSHSFPVSGGKNHQAQALLGVREIKRLEGLGKKRHKEAPLPGSKQVALSGWATMLAHRAGDVSC